MDFLNTKKDSGSSIQLSVQTNIGEIEKLAGAISSFICNPVNGGEMPPSDPNNDNDEEDARAQIFSDPYFNLGLSSPGIGILDTRCSHNTSDAEFTGPDWLGARLHQWRQPM